MRVIGLIGPKGSGKDASYEMLRDAKRVDGKISFAGPLKEICGKVFDLHFNLLNDPDLKEKALKEPITLTRKHIKTIIQLCETYVPSVTEEGRVLYWPGKVTTIGLEGRQFRTPRELMQIIGTELIRDRIWKAWHREAAFSEKALTKLKAQGTYAVTDVRFLDEHEFLANKYGKAYVPFYVDRPEASAKLATATHQSELETQKIREMLADSVIDNSGDLDDLKSTLKDLQLPVYGTDQEVADPNAPKKSKFRYAEK